MVRSRVGIYGLVILVLLAYLVPLFYVLDTALKSQGQYATDPSGLTKTLKIDNFVDAWNRADFGRFLVNSLIYTLGSALTGTTASLLIAFPVARGYLRRSRLWNAVLVLALFLPVALITQFQLILRLGLYDNPIGYMLLMSASVGIGPLLIVSYLKAMPTELDEAAAMERFWVFPVPRDLYRPLGSPCPHHGLHPAGALCLE